VSDDEPTVPDPRAAAAGVEESDGRAGDAGAERALERLERWASDPAQRVIVVNGPAALAGALVGVFAAQYGERFRLVRFASPSLDPDALSRRILDSLGELDDERPRAALVRLIQETGAPPILLLIEEAQRLSPRTEMWLFDLVRRSGGALRVLLALADPKPAKELAAAYHGRTEVVPIDEPAPRIAAHPDVGRVARERAAVAQARREERESLESTAVEAVSEAPTVAAPPLPGPARPRPRPPSPAARKPGPPPELARRDDTLRWLLLPAALAACFVAGFVTSELLQALRGGREVARAPAPIASTAPRAAEAEPPAVASPPPSAAPAQAKAADSPLTMPPRASQPPAEAPAVASRALAASPPSSAPALPGASPPESAAAPVPSPAAEAPPTAAVEPAGEEAQPPKAPERRHARAPARPSTPRGVTVGVSAEPGTQITIDGRALGAAPVDEVELASGPHRLVATLPDGRVVDRVVDVQGSRYDIHLR